MSEDHTARLIEAALALSKATGASEFSVKVPNSRPPRWVSLHEGPVHLGLDGESQGGVPGSPELRTLVEDLVEKAFQGQADLHAVQQAVLDFVTALRESGPSNGRAPR
jgi:hypothetical protein